MRRCLCGEDNTSMPVLNINANMPVSTNCCSRDERLLDNLCRFIGNRCICEFTLSCSNETEEISGILEKVGCDFIVIQTCNNRRIICNTDKLVFVTIL